MAGVSLAEGRCQRGFSATLVGGGGREAGLSDQKTLPAIEAVDAKRVKALSVVTDGDA